MQITDQTIVNIYNYADNPVSLPTHIKPDGYWFEPAIDDSPSMIPISFAEVRVANSQSQVFREGKLRFDKTVEAEIYEALKIRDWENILTLKEIEDTILNPTQEKLEKIIAFTSITSFDRIRGALVRLQNTGQHDISQRVIDAINYRYQELYRNKRKTEIVIHKTKQEMMEEVKDEIIQTELEKAKKELEKKIRAEIEAELKKETKTTTAKKDDKTTKKG